MLCITTDYPYRDLKSKPHMDTRLPHYPLMDRITALRRVLADNVDRERKKRGLTQPQLAKKAGMAQSHISRIINARSGATIDRLAQLAHTFGMEPAQLLVKGAVEDDKRPAKG